MKKTKIDWADSSWNPVAGCYHGCEYCYARNIANRFGGQIITGHDHVYVLDEPFKKDDGTILPYPYGFDPTFHRYRLDIPQQWKDPQRIFVCSMSDLFGEWVPQQWIEEVITACKRAPQHTYLFLTKNPKRYLELAAKEIIPCDDNFWYGSTTDVNDRPFWFARDFHTFVSVEPILERFTFEKDADKCLSDWVIIGAETGRRKGRVIPKREWIMDFVDYGKKTDTPIFMKESLREIMGDDFIQQTPWEAKNEQNH